MFHRWHWHHRRQVRAEVDRLRAIVVPAASLHCPMLHCPMLHCPMLHCPIRTETKTVALLVDIFAPLRCQFHDERERTEARIFSSSRGAHRIFGSGADARRIAVRIGFSGRRSVCRHHGWAANTRLGRKHSDDGAGSAECPRWSDEGFCIRLRDELRLGQILGGSGDSSEASVRIRTDLAHNYRPALAEAVASHVGDSLLRAATVIGGLWACGLYR
jgi:hypothetical protein